MSSDLVKQALLSLLPEGSAWSLKDNGDFDKTMDGQAANWEYIRARFDELSEIRNPRTTPLLSDLEREYGIIADPSLTEATRRARLAAIVYAPVGVGSASYLQARLQEAGFNVYVHSNDPAVDPVPFLDQLSGAQLGEPGFELGEDAALLGSYSSDLIVAGEISRNEFTFTATCGNPQITCGAVEATCGAADFSIDPIEYPDPTDADRWRYVFFIGGTAERNVFRDGDMERLDLNYYRSVDGGYLTKDTGTKFSGAQSLKVVGSGTGQPGAQTKIILPEGTTTFTLTGKVIPSGGTPVVYQSATAGVAGTARWNGGITGIWQTINVVLNAADGEYITLGTFSSGNTMHFDVMSILLDGALFGKIQSISTADIDGARRDEFLRTVLKWKPMHTWGIALIEWT